MQPGIGMGKEIHIFHPRRDPVRFYISLRRGLIVARLSLNLKDQLADRCEERKDYCCGKLEVPHSISSPRER
jgi:hypothetical protein